MPQGEEKRREEIRKLIREETGESSSKKWIVLVLIIIIVVGSIFAFFIFAGGETAQETIDCGNNMDCFIEAAENCNKAKVTDTITLNLFGILTTTTGFSEIKGMEENKCILYLRTESQELRFSDELVQQMLNAGSTLEQIQQQEQESNKIADSVKGKDGICKFSNTDDLASLLTKQKQGKFSGGVSCKLVGDGLEDADWECTNTGDWAVAECEGEMFAQRAG